MKIFFSRWRWYLVAVLLLGNIFVWPQVRKLATGRALTLAALDVGQGDALFLTDAVGHQILIDGGPDSKVLAELGQRLPLSDRDLDLLILTHPHADHLAGLVEVLKRYRVGAVLESGALYQSATYDEWHRLLQEQKVPVIPARRGERIPLAGGATLEVLAPFDNWLGRGAKNIHESMVVLRLISPQASAWLTGDMEALLEAALLAVGDGAPTDLLKVGHHGSRTSTSAAFLRALSPHDAFISVGARNRYGHPHPEILTRLAAAGINIWRTDERGTIIATSNEPAHGWRVSVDR